MSHLCSIEFFPGEKIYPTFDPPMLSDYFPFFSFVFFCQSWFVLPVITETWRQPPKFISINRFVLFNHQSDPHTRDSNVCLYRALQVDNDVQLSKSAKKKKKKQAARAKKRMQRELFPQENEKPPAISSPIYNSPASSHPRTIVRDEMSKEGDSMLSRINLMDSFEFSELESGLKSPSESSYNASDSSESFSDTISPAGMAPPNSGATTPKKSDGSCFVGGRCPDILSFPEPYFEYNPADLDKFNLVVAASGSCDSSFSSQSSSSQEQTPLLDQKEDQMFLGGTLGARIPPQALRSSKRNKRAPKLFLPPEQEMQVMTPRIPKEMPRPVELKHFKEASDFALSAVEETSPAPLAAPAADTTEKNSAIITDKEEKQNPPAGATDTTQPTENASFESGVPLIDEIMKSKPPGALASPHLLFGLCKHAAVFTYRIVFPGRA
jgi:hypothetical protein